MPKSHTTHHDIANFETALNHTGKQEYSIVGICVESFYYISIFIGHGIFNYVVLSTCSLGLLAVGFQNGIMAYLLPSARCDLDMTTGQMGGVNASFMIGLIKYN